ncbi:MAG: hypothetical protein GQ563_06980 [Desulfuromusa sp.]|nr:hypothetical protein [Desulfuromusa sp.]
MKTLVKIVLLVGLLSLFSTPTIANTSRGKIIDILDGGVTTIQFSEGHTFKTGDTFELTYMAGSLPMAIGEYEVTTCTADICLSRPVAMSMPPSKGMTVEVSSTKNPEQPIRVKKKQKPASTPQHPAVQLNPTPTSKPIEIIGSVIAVNGDEIKVRTNGNRNPQVGWFIDLFYVTSQGKELPVGTWKIQSIAERDLTAIKIKGMGDANKQLKAVIYNHKKKPTAVKTAPPQKNLVKNKPFAASRAKAASAPPTRQQQPIQLLGKTAPTAPPKKITANPHKKNLTLPPGVKKKPTPKKRVQPRDPEVTRLLKLLKGDDSASKRNAAKIITRNNYKDPVLYDQVNKELLKGYSSARSKLEVDTMAWLCKALASSKNHKYYETVNTVARKARNRKLKKYAKKSLQQLK